MKMTSQQNTTKWRCGEREHSKTWRQDKERESCKSMIKKWTIGTIHSDENMAAACGKVKAALVVSWSNDSRRQNVTGNGWSSRSND